jgi:hypothetical protein
MKKYCTVTALFMLIALVLIGCGGRKAVNTQNTSSPDGKTIELYILSDRGNADEMTAAQYKNRQQVGQWMEQDMIRIFNRAGYAATLLQSRDEFTPGPGKYLLSVSIVNYNPGSKAARIVVGFGAGAVSLDNHYDLYGEATAPLLSYDDGVGSSRDWKNCARKLNENALKRVSQRLSEL